MSILYDAVTQALRILERTDHDPERAYVHTGMQPLFSIDMNGLPEEEQTLLEDAMVILGTEANRQGALCDTQAIAPAFGKLCALQRSWEVADAA